MFSVTSAIEGLHKELKQLDASLTVSFSNLKNDISKQASMLKQIKSRIGKHEELIQQLRKDIEVLHGQQKTQQIKHISDKSAFGNRSEKSTERSVSVRRTPNAGLTPLHLELLKRILLLQMENGKRAVSMRELAAEVYPTKEYARIKSTLSEYVGKLHNAGLVEKMQKGRLYLSYTEKALQYADEQRINRMKELISKPR